MESQLVLIIDNGHVHQWQLDALERLKELPPLVVPSCTNTVTRKRPFGHAFYYGLNILAMRNRWTRKVPLPGSSVVIAETISFASEYDGAWQRLPAPLIERLSEAAPLAIVKFGMSLLKVPPEIKAPILSYHHGDPDRYRGRPAGFYETLHGEPVMGQIVQVISNKLDAGAVVAFGETKVFPHSYRATLKESYRHSPLFLNEAMRNVIAGKTIPKESSGKNYRLPGNATVARFLLGMLWKLVLRLLYGALVEKNWHVSRAPLQVPVLNTLAEGRFPPESSWEHVPQGDFTFLADPFFSRSPPGLLVEAMNPRTGKGEILLVDEEGRHASLSDPLHHFSYPATIEEEGVQFIVPETATWSSPRIYRIGKGQLEEVDRLHIPGDPAVIDPTLYRHEGHLYLFGNVLEVGPNTLFLWHSRSLFEPFEPHPASPIRISPAGGRMGGAIIRSGSGIYRIGQNYLRGYGDGVFLFRINNPSTAAYSEELVQKLKFGSAKGPHTVNFGDGRVVFDWYVERKSPMAGIRRLLGKYF